MQACAAARSAAQGFCPQPPHNKHSDIMTNAPQTAAFYRGDKSFSVEQVAPVSPARGDVSVKIAYCGICGTDMHVFHGNMDARVGHERIIGHEMSGVVHALGEGVDGPSIGTKVVVRPLQACGDCPACNDGHAHICHNLKFLGLDTDGAMQDVWNVPAHTLHVLPDDLPLDHAALIEPVAVACHDVRLSELKAGENVVVIGGGPIGILVAMIARDAGGTVVISEVNEHRLAVASKLGFETINPAQSDLESAVGILTGGKGAEVVFEVSGTQPGVDAMTQVAATRARIARVYEPEDYEKAIEAVASGAIDCETVITDVTPLAEIQSAFESLDRSPTAMKSLIKVSGDAQAALHR